MDRADMNALARAIMTLYVLLFFSPVLAQTSALTTTERVAGCWEFEFNISPAEKFKVYPSGKKVLRNYFELCFSPSGSVSIVFVDDGHGSSTEDEWTADRNGNIRIGDEDCRVSFNNENIAELTQCRLVGSYKLRCRILEISEKYCK